MLEVHPVTGVGQINVGDTIVIENIKGIKFVAKARDVFNKGTEFEEILLTKKSNKYFLMELFLAGKSWVKKVYVLNDVKLFSVSNTTKTNDYC